MRNGECFTQTSDHDCYYRIAYRPPMGDLLQTCYCISLGAQLCREAGKKILIVVRVPNGSYDYSLNDYRAISDCWKEYCQGLTVLMVDEQATDTMVITTGINQYNGVDMILFRSERDAIQFACETTEEY